MGKSSLMNLLSGCVRAIVSDIPGTTRDVIADRVSVGRVMLNLSDTAGIRDTEDEIERLGTRLAVEKAEGAALIIALFDGSGPLDERDMRVIDMAEAEKTVAVINKSDLRCV